MVKKSKISHFTQTNTTGSKPDSNADADRSRLARLYPQPKTYEQKEQDTKLLQRAYRLHWPKYPYFNIAAYGSVLLGLTVWFVQNLYNWWFGNSDWGLTMSTIFFSFVIWLVLTLLLIVWVNYTNKQFAYFGGMIRVFWIVYTILTAVLLVLWLSGWIWDYTNILCIPVLTVFHFIVMFFIAKRIIGRTL